MKNTTLGIIGVVVAGGLAWVGRNLYKNNKTIRNAVDNLSERTEVSVTDEMVKAAAEKAANDAARKAIDIVRNDIQRTVKSEVEKCYDEALKKTSEEFVKQVSEKINVDDVKKEIENKAASIIVKKFTTKMNEYGSLFDMFGRAEGRYSSSF